MDREIIVLSRCVKEVRRSSFNLGFEFHFKGVYKGEKIKKIIIQNNTEDELIIGNEYLLKIKFVSISKNTLYGDLVQSKDLENIYVNL